MKLSWQVLELRTKHEFTIARAAAPPVRRNVWVRIRSGLLREGWGEAAPNSYYNETADTVVAALARYRRLLEPINIRTIADVEAFEQRLAKFDSGNASARAAVSAALYDLLGKREREPVWQLLDLDVSTAPASSFTIGIDEVERMRAHVREARDYRILKIKVGTPNDEAILTMLREERPDAIIRVDANTAWTADEAIAKLPMLEACNVELIEQPLPPDDLDGLARVMRASPIPIIADESCKTAGDVKKLHGCVHGVNIKLAKCGSLDEAMRIASAARKYGMQVMIGCMIESTLGIAAALQLTPLCDYVDLDGAALLANDPFAGPGIEADGSLRFNQEKGLGVRTRK